MFWTAVFLFVIGIIGAVVAYATRNMQETPYGRPVPPLAGKIVMAAGLGLGVLFLLIASVTQVSTKNVGVVTSFGQPVGTLSNGIHLKAPWQKVTELDGAIQTDNHVGDGEDDKSPCTSIRIGNDSTACVDNSIRWRIKADRADALYRDYRDFDKIRDSLVTRELTESLNVVFGTFDPLKRIQAGATPDAPAQGTIDVSAFGEDVTRVLQQKVGQDVEILNVIIPLVRYDTETQNKINAYQAEVANTRIAEQRKATATQEALANKLLSSSVSNDPNVLVSKCFDTLNQMVKDKQQVPAGFSCWPGGSSAVVVPSAQNSGGK